MGVPSWLMSSPEEEMRIANEAFERTAIRNLLDIREHRPNPERFREYRNSLADRAWIVFVTGWLSAVTHYRGELVNELTMAQIARQGGVN